MASPEGGFADDIVPALDLALAGEDGPAADANTP